MLSKKLQCFIEKTGRAFVASADHRARPHLAAGRDLKVPDSHHIVFESWLCPRTVENVSEVPRAAVVVIDAASGIGFQFACRVKTAVKKKREGVPSSKTEEPGVPHDQWQIVLRVEEILEFSDGRHSDQPLGTLI